MNVLHEKGGRKLVIPGVIFIIIFAGGLWLALRDGSDTPSDSEDTSADRVGRFSDTQRGEDEGYTEQRNFGRVQPVSADATAQTASVREAYEAARNGDNSLTHRISPYVEVPAFEPEKWDSDEQYRKAYLDQHVPGRVFRTAQPGPTVPILRPAGNRFYRIEQGQEVTLKALAPSGAAVTFTSFDLGKFRESQLTSVTVVADERGIASATFVATRGTHHDCRILAGGPMTSGQVRYLVTITIPPEVEARGQR